MIADFIIFMMNSIISFIAGVINSIFSLLPDSPFNINNIETSVIVDYLSYLNWILPIDKIIIITLSWITAISVYYVYQIILRWIKAIE